MWGIDIEEFKKNPDVYLNDFLRDDEVLAIETEERPLVVMTMEHYMKSKSKALAEGFQIGVNHMIEVPTEDL